jgi:hypothetical protein
MAQGLYEADLGGNVLKKRVARTGQGRRGGFRTLVASDRRGRWIFMFGFAKNERDNIDTAEHAALRKLAATLLTMPQSAVAAAERAGELLKVNCDE